MTKLPWLRMPLKSTSGRRRRRGDSLPAGPLARTRSRYRRRRILAPRHTGVDLVDVEPGADVLVLLVAADLGDVEHAGDVLDDADGFGVGSWRGESCTQPPNLGRLETPPPSDSALDPGEASPCTQLELVRSWNLDAAGTCTQLLPLLRRVLVRSRPIYVRSRPIYVRSRPIWAGW